jgi:beta-N-acetylhexosaminidase
MAGFDGTVLDAHLRGLIADLKVGGIILFSRNLESPEQIARLCGSAQEYARSCGQPPLFIAIDQEGGEVARLKAPFTRFPGNPAIDGEEDAGRFAETTADELLGVGINMNMAPVLDLSPPGVRSVMAGRAFAGDPARVAALGRTVIGRLQEKGVIAVAKHFPGIGRTTLDSHLDLPTLETPAATLRGFDIPPFSAAIGAGVGGMMLSHVRYTDLDPVWPASLSSHIARDLLRNDLGFDGVVITDDLDMGAIRRRFDFREAVSRILAAEIDIVLICHAGPDIAAAFDQIGTYIEGKEKERRMGEESVARILALKRRFLGEFHRE